MVSVEALRSVVPGIVAPEEGNEADDSLDDDIDDDSSSDDSHDSED